MKSTLMENNGNSVTQNEFNVCADKFNKPFSINVCVIWTRNLPSVSQHVYQGAQRINNKSPDCTCNNSCNCVCIDGL
jgi:hypothetical protein